MTTILQPKVTVNKLPASLPAPLEEQKILVIGQKLASGSATTDVLLEDVSKSDVNNLVGEGSFLQNSVFAIFDVFEQSGSTIIPQVDIIPLDDAGAGVAATATIVVSEVGGATNAATVAGTISVIIGSKFLYKFDVDVSVDTAIITGAGNIGDAITDAINADSELPVTAINTGGSIALTCRHKGTLGNGITIKIEGLALASGDYVLGNVELTLTAFASGATDPTLPTLSTVVGENNRYQQITHPVEYGIAFSVTNFLDARFNVDNNILDGVAIVKDTDTQSNLKTTLDTFNSQSLIYLCDEIVADAIYDGATLIDFDFVISARFAALRAMRKTDGANITRLVTNSAGFLDQTGGIHMATFPYFNTTVFSVSPIDAGKGFTELEIEELVDKGGTVIGNNVVGNTVILGEVLTTYKTDSGGNADTTWKFLNTVDTLSVAAEYIFNNIKSDFSQTRLTDGNLIDGFAMVNEASFKGQMKKYYIDLSELAIVPNGKEAIDFFVNNTVILVSLVSGSITSNSNLRIVTQLRDILVNLKTTFST